MALLSQSIQTTKATLSLITDDKFSTTTPIYVDNSLNSPCYRVSISLSGNLNNVLLNSPNGNFSDLNFKSYFNDGILDDLVIDVFDNSSIISSGLSFEIVYRSQNLINFNFKPDREGMWTLKSESTSQFTLEVAASCTFNFLANLYRLDWDSSHPSLAIINGQPISSKKSSRTLKIIHFRFFIKILFLTLWPN